MVVARDVVSIDIAALGGVFALVATRALAAARVGANRFCLPARGHVRRLDGVHDARRLPDQPHGLRPRGYRFTDYVRVGAPLQVLLAVVTTLGIAFFWGVT